MTSTSAEITPFAIADRVYVIGSFETGVTVYSQQVRALNLVHLLCKDENLIPSDEVRVGVVGGGIAGLTAASAILVRRPRWRVSIFERRADLCPLQQGSDSRWLHPHIYAWPRPGSRNPSAALPILNWREGRASDVADGLLREWDRICRKAHPSVYLDTKHLRVNATNREVEWIGSEVCRTDASISLQVMGRRSQFDVIILAIGFGEEVGAPDFPVTSYWRNESYSQPRLDDKLQRFLVSGYGDGALVDLFRLRIERFRQDRIVDDLFDFDTESELKIYDALKDSPDRNVFSILERLTNEGMFTVPAEKLSQRLRKDTQAILHIRPKGNLTRLCDVFDSKSSLLNKILLFLLYRCGGFIPTFDELHVAVAKYGVEPDSVICRHGTFGDQRFAEILEDYVSIKRRTKEMRFGQTQDVKIMWSAGDWDKPEV